MGCSTSKLEDEDAVRLCHDRKNFIKQAIEQRNQLAYVHVEYIRSLKGVAIALCHYVDDEELQFFLASFMTAPMPPQSVRGVHPAMIPKKLFAPQENHSRRSTFSAVHYMKAGWTPSISVEEWPEPMETVRPEYNYSTSHFGFDGYVPAEAATMGSSYSSPYARPRYPPASPQASQMDSFWNPFSPLNTYGYPYGSNSEDVLLDEDSDQLRKVRQREGIPELEEEDDDEDREEIQNVPIKSEIPRIYSKHIAKPVASGGAAEADRKEENVNETKELRSQGVQTTEVSETSNAVELEVNNGQGISGTRNGPQETPGFTVYVNRRPISMGEVMKDVEAQFTRICNFADELSVILEVGTAQPSSSPFGSFRMLNPAALLRSTSSRSSSFRFLQASSSSTNDDHESSSNGIEESCIAPRSHKSTLDRLHQWEKKLYEEVKCAERIRIEYEKKCRQLRIHDVHGEEPFVVDKTRAAIRDLRTQLRVSISSVEYISKRIEVLRDQDLHPLVMELIRGLARMWRTMAECHRIQKRTIDEAKLLLFSPSAAAGVPARVLPGPSRSAASLEAELRNWASRLSAWVQTQRCYARALAGWIRRCAPPARDATAPTPSRSGASGAAPPVYIACVRWSRMLDSVSEAAAIEGVEMFAAGVASVAASVPAGQGKEGVLETMDPEAAVAAAAELGAKVVCAGLAVAVGAVAELAANSAEGYEELVKTLDSRVS
ncbi:nitrate regulatory gene2 protein-like [Curcuma longa]|uniref:nitrate regulatory gene2 protein-like n=1 Tax=Curcuma longa TaxID=136217 RepID=UPI003D9DE2C1